HDPEYSIPTGPGTFIDTPSFGSQHDGLDATFSFKFFRDFTFPDKGISLRAAINLPDGKMIDQGFVCGFTDSLGDDNVSSILVNVLRKHNNTVVSGSDLEIIGE